MASEDKKAKNFEKEVIGDPERKESGQVEPEKAVHPKIRPEAPPAEPEE